MTTDSNETPASFYDACETFLLSFSAGNIEGALEQAEVLNKDFPEQAEPYFFLGLLSYFFHDRPRAIELIEKAHKLAPDVRDYVDALANILAMMGRHADGLFYAKLATTIEPHEHLKSLLPVEFGDYFRSLSMASPSYHYPTALGMFNVHQIDKSISHCERELRTNPDHHAAHDLIGRCYLASNDPFRARRAFQSAVHFAPEIAIYKLHLAQSLAQIGLYDQALECLNQAQKIDVQNDDERSHIQSGVLALLHTFPRVYKGHLDAHIKLLNEMETDIYRFGTTASDEPAEKIIIGFLGSRFDTLNEISFVRPLLATINRNRFETHVFYNGTAKDSTVQYLETIVDSWTHSHDVDDDTMFAIMRGNNLDILVDLDGACTERRGEILAATPAPTIITWPNERARSDLPSQMSIDTLLKQAGLNDISPITREPIPDAPPSASLPAMTRGILTFGGLASAENVNSKTVVLWSQILHAIPNAQILLGWRGNAPAETAIYLSDLFNDHGLSDRVSFHRCVDDEELSEFGSSFFDNIDILLDTSPSCAADFLSEALWMGVPTVCMAHDASGSQSIGAHVLKQAEKNEWIASSYDDYLAIATNLATNIKNLSKTRKALRDELSSSKLFSPEKTVNDFERLLETLMQLKTKDA